MSEAHAWYMALSIAAITLATFLTRSGLHLVGPQLRLPLRLESALRYAPACALTAIIVPDLFVSGGALDVSLHNARLLGGVAGVVIFATSRSILATIGGGMAAFWILRWIG
jgi:branched-subunit amino acid transport protein